MWPLSKFLVFSIYLLFSVLRPCCCHDYRRVDDNYTFLIKGGDLATSKNYINHLASIRSRQYVRFFGDNHLCGGTIIAPNKILTAGHCAMYTGTDVPIRPSDLRIVTGTYNRLVKTTDTKVSSVYKIVAHPSYSAQFYTDDIAIITLKKNLHGNSKTAESIPLNDKPVVPGMNCTIIGWGRIIHLGPLSPVVLYAEIPIWDMEECRLMFPMMNGEGFLCAGDMNDFEKDACTGDSGGPLICDGKLTGIVSFGFGCGTPGYPGVYTDVYHYRGWIDSNIAGKVHLNYTLYIFLILVYVFR